MIELMNAFPGLTAALKIADFVAGCIIGTIQLLFWVMFLPFLIICWCFYHPTLAKVYIANAIPLLWTNGWAGRAVLGIMILLLMLLPKPTHNFAKWTLQSLCLIGFVAYIVAIF